MKWNKKKRVELREEKKSAGKRKVEEEEDRSWVWSVKREKMEKGSKEERKKLGDGIFLGFCYALLEVDDWWLMMKGVN